MARFDDTVALISGGARGMGASHVRALVEAGARVAFGDVLDDEGRALAAELGDHAHYIRLDVTRDEDWKAAVAEAEEAFAPINLLVNNAGVVGFSPLADMAPDEFRRVIDINLFGVFLGMHHAIPSMRRAGGGAIINVSSTAGMMGYANIGAYVASKWGVRGLTKTAALELGRDGIRVVSVHPGPIRTPMTADLGGDLAAGQPIPRIGEPEEVTRLVLFLAAEATYSTGSEFIVDGGALLGPVGPLLGE
jgi:3alpha(or 20beta)-hydroxysteroid dehydrogenase